MVYSLAKQDNNIIYSRENGYIFRVASLPFTFCIPIKWVQLIEERICSSGDKLFFLRVDSFLKRFHSPEKRTENHKSTPYQAVWSQGYQKNFMLNSTEHETLNAHNNKNIQKVSIFQAQISLEYYFSCS